MSVSIPSNTLPSLEDAGSEKSRGEVVESCCY